MKREVLERYLSYCDKKMSKDKFYKFGDNHFSILRQTDKAVQINFKITDLREFDVESGERIYKDGTYTDDTYLVFWCPKKFMDYELKNISCFFVSEKIKEELSK